MQENMKKILFILLSLACFNCFSQNAVSATYGIEIPTNYSTFGFNYNCSVGYLSLSLPAGKTYNVTSVTVTYKMTALNFGRQADQFSSIEFLNTNTEEATEAQNNITAAGTFIYSRIINIANGNYNGGTALNFALRARRSWLGSFFICGTDVNKVDANSWKITVNYSNEVPYSYVGVGADTPFIAKLEVAGVAGTGSTSAVFGSDGTGISLQRNLAAIGFNQYRDNNFGFGKYIAGGAASVFSLNQSTGNMALDMYSTGIKNTSLGIGNRAISISNSDFVNSGCVGFGGNADPNILFSLNKNAFNTNATAVFAGSEYSSFFCNGINEDTYIRGGLNNSKLFINELSGGNGNVYNGNVKIIGKLAIGLGASQNPNVTTEIHGGLGFAKHPLVNATSGTGIPVGNSSYIEVASIGINPLIKLSDFESLGQILILKSVNKMQLKFSPGPSAYIQLQAGDTIMLIGDKIVQSVPGGANDLGYYWAILSISHNK